MSNKAPAFPWYASDFLTDTQTWSEVEVAVHVRLLSWSWVNGPIPASFEELTRISPSAKLVWKRVGPKWVKSKGYYTNTKLEVCRENKRLFHESQREKSLLAAEARKNSGNTNGTSMGSPTGVPYEKEKSIKSSQGKERAKAPDGFDAFWSVYPLHKARAKAEEAWAKLKPEQAALCLPAIEAQVKARHFTNTDGKEFIPHGATWLNQRRWEDEVRSFPVITTNGKPLTKEQGYALMNEIRKNNGLTPDDPVPQHLMTRELIELFNR